MNSNETLPDISTAPKHLRYQFRHWVLMTEPVRAFDVLRQGYSIDYDQYPEVQSVAFRHWGQECGRLRESGQRPPSVHSPHVRNIPVPPSQTKPIINIPSPPPIRVPPGTLFTLDHDQLGE